jgi:predicted enzyme related to lactoylglutathione lyase
VIVLKAFSLALVFACLALSVTYDQAKQKQNVEKEVPVPKEARMIQGLRLVMYHVGDMQKAKEWYTKVLGYAPYFDEPFYAGYHVGGFELGLNPDESKAAGPGGAYAYWGVKDCKAAYQRLLDLGAKPNTPVEDVGGGILAATVTDPWGNVFGVIENPHFKLEDAGE